MRGEIKLERNIDPNANRLRIRKREQNEKKNKKNSKRNSLKKI